jgi:hypothetical protein
MKEYPVICFCGSPASLQDNSLLYNGKSYGNGKAYICDRFPECRGSVGVHPNGKPLGTIPDQETKKLRMAVHAVIDPLWRNQVHQPKRVARGAVYGYLRHIMGMTAEECHIGNFTAADCRKALRAIEQLPFEVRDV